MDWTIILMYLALATISSIECKAAARGLIKEIAINPRFFPKYYILPKPRIRKRFGIKQTQIPKYLYYQLYISILFAALGPFNSFVYICTNDNITIAGILVLIHVALIIVNSSYVVIISLIFKKFR